MLMLLLGFCMCNRRPFDITCCCNNLIICQLVHWQQVDKKDECSLNDQFEGFRLDEIRQQLRLKKHGVVVEGTAVSASIILVIMEVM